MYCDHLYAANHKEHLPSVAVDDEGGAHEGAQVHRTEYDGAHQSGVAPESDDLEHQRRKEREHNDADELEEHGHGHGKERTRCGRYSIAASTALAMSLGSASGPRTRSSAARPLMTRLLGVSVRKNAPTKMTTAGRPAHPPGPGRRAIPAATKPSRPGTEERPAVWHHARPDPRGRQGMRLPRRRRLEPDRGPRLWREGENRQETHARQIRGGGIARIFRRRGVCFSKC